MKGQVIPLEECSSQQLYGKVKVFINGNWIGIPAGDPHELYLYIKDKKLPRYY